jgi:hypothetical protein
MKTVLAFILVSLPLSSPFGEASATATSTDGGLRFEVSVEVQGSPVAVLVRGVGSGASELPPVALGDQGDGTWAGIVQLPVVENIRVGFEFIPASGPASVSDLHTLTDLGVDRAVFEHPAPSTSQSDEDEPLVSPEGRRWGWMALAAGAAALTLIALWAIGSVRRVEGDEIVESVDDEARDDGSHESPVDI